MNDATSRIVLAMECMSIYAENISQAAHGKEDLRQIIKFG
jgi:hypothetical protein